MRASKSRTTTSCARGATGAPRDEAGGAATAQARPNRSSNRAARCGTPSIHARAALVATTNGSGPRVSAAVWHRDTSAGIDGGREGPGKPGDEIVGLGIAVHTGHPLIACQVLEHAVLGLCSPEDRQYRH